MRIEEMIENVLNNHPDDTDMQERKAYVRLQKIQQELSRLCCKSNHRHFDSQAGERKKLLDEAAVLIEKIQASNPACNSPPTLN